MLPEYDPPTGTVEINGKDAYVNGDDTYTRYAAVTLKISSSDTDVKQMCVSNGPTCSGWVPYAPVDAKPWTLPAGSGMKTVRVWFRDINGNVGGPFSHTIYLDTTKPVNGTLAIAPGVAENNFRALLGRIQPRAERVAGYKLVVGTAGYPACTATTPLRGHGDHVQPRGPDARQDLLLPGLRVRRCRERVDRGDELHVGSAVT